MPSDCKERALEAGIEHHLLTAGGYAVANPVGFERERAMCAAGFIFFVKAMQPEVWPPFEKRHGTETEAVVLDDLTKALVGQAGALAVRVGKKGPCDGR